MRSEAYVVALSFLCAVFAALVIPKAASGTFAHNDESLTAERSREMLLTKDYLTVHADFEPDFSKPPLQYYLTTLSLRTISNPQLAVRLWSVVYAVACLLLTAVVFLQVQPGERATALFSVGFVAANGHFIDSSRIALLDNGGTFFLLGTVAAAFAARSRPRLWIVAGVMAGLGAWQKNCLSLAALLALIAIQLMRNRRRQSLPMKHLFGGVVVAAALSATWPMLQILQYGYAGVVSSLQNETQFLVHGYASAPKSNPLFFVEWILREWLMFGAVAMVMLVASFVVRRLRSNMRSFEIAALTLAYLVTISCFQARNKYYSIPLIPFLAILGVASLSFLCGKTRKLLYALLLGLFIPAACLAYFHFAKPTRNYSDQVSGAVALAQSAKHDEKLLAVGQPGNDQSLPCEFVLYYGHFQRPIEYRTLAQLGTLPAGQRLRGLLYSSLVARVKPQFSQFNIVSTHGDYVVFTAVQ